MKKALSPIAKVFAVLFAIFFVITLVSTLFFYNLEQHAFDTETYKKALHNENIYERLPAVIGDQLVVSMGIDHCAENPLSCETEYRSVELETCLIDALGSESYRALSNNERPLTEAENERITPCYEEHGYPATNEGEEELLASLTKNLTAKDWEDFIIAIVPPEELEYISESTLDEIFNYLNGNSDTAAIPLMQFKKRLISKEGTDAVMALIKAQPDCTTSDLLKIAQGEIAICHPPDMIMPALEPLINMQLQTAASTLPDQQILTQKKQAQESILEMQALRALMRLSPLVPIILLLLITLLAVRDLLSWLRWWGIPLLIAGIIGVLMSLITAPLVRALLSIPLTGGISMEVSGSALKLIYDLAESVVHSFVEDVVLYSIIFGIIGLIMTITSIFIKWKEKSAAEAI